MNPIIEFCMSNLGSWSWEAFDKLEEDISLDVLEYDCCDHCDLCLEGPYALVNGDFVSSETPDELVANVYKHLKESPMF